MLDKHKFIQNVERVKERNSGFFCQNLSGVNRSFMIINWHSTHCFWVGFLKNFGFRLLRLKNLWADMRALKLDDL